MTTLAVPAAASAWTNWDNPATAEEDWCATCHGAFNPPGTADVHAMHTAEISDCTLCHVTVGDSPLLGSSPTDAYGTSPGAGCSGCHGRVDATTGESRAYGLRAFHAGMGVTTCADCHTDPAAEPESVDPLNYGGSLTTVVSACNEDGSEDWDGDGTGLDNDGDGDYDLDDPDCEIPVDAGVDAGMEDAGVDAGPADAGLDAAVVTPDAAVTPDAGVAPPDAGARDAGSPPVDDDDDGCGCATPGAGGSTGGGLAAILGLGALVLLRRRRRG